MIDRLLRMLLCLALLLFAAPASAAGQGIAYKWKNVTVGAGGFAPNIVFSRAEESLAYLRTDMGGAYRWDNRLKRWIALQDGNSVSSYMGIESIAPDPVDPDVVYLAAGMHKNGEAAIMRSADRGATWRVTPVSFKMGGNEAGRGLGERLAIDPNRTSTLFFGSRHDGLQRSDDSGRTWRKVESFPHPGLGVPAGRRTTNAGIAFVLFDSASGSAGRGTKILYAGVADPSEQHLFRSTDGGSSWSPVQGGPPADMLPVKAAIDARGQLYVAYSTSIGPNDVEGGSVWKLDTSTGRWTDITPDRSPAAEGGYMGLSLDPQRPGRIAVSSMNRWQRGDTIWLSDDDGRTWSSLRERSRRDTSASPFLNWGREEAEFGHWIAGLAIDPFDSGTIAYATGATVYRTDDGEKDRLFWKPWVKGIEQTAVITLVSPTGGAPLISGFGDLGGFVHERLDVSPPIMHLNPRLTNTNTLDYAGLRPEIVVRSGSRHIEQGAPEASLAWSEDGGKTWQPIRVPPLAIGTAPPQRYDRTGEAPIHVSADGKVFIVSTPQVMATRYRGRSWYAPAGVPQGARIIADKADADLFYAIDFDGGRLFVSRDGALSFTPVEANGLPHHLSPSRPRNREAQSPVQAVPGRAGELWFKLEGRLYRSIDAGRLFVAASGNDIAIEQFGLGKEAPGASVAAIYATGTKDRISGVWRSIDGGVSWARINDDAHQWGLRFRAISGDPRRFGRVYLATDGRGILYGDPADLR